MLMAASNGDIATWFVIVMGLCVVFVGLIAIILIVTLVSKIIALFPEKKAEAKPAAAPVAAPAQETVIPNRGEFVAAVSAVIAEELGTDVSKIRIESIRKL